MVYAQPAVKAIRFTHGLLLEIDNGDDHIVRFNPLILTQI